MHAYDCAIDMSWDYRHVSYIYKYAYLFYKVCYYTLLRSNVNFSLKSPNLAPVCMEGAVVKNAKSGWAKSVLIKMRCQLKKIALLVLAISVAISCYIAYLLILKRLKPPDEENSEHILPGKLKGFNQQV